MARFATIAEGLAFLEGSVALSDGSVIVVEGFAGRITRCWRDRKETICEAGDGPNGAAIGPDGALYVCNNGGVGAAYFARSDRICSIERVDLASGRCERIYEACDGQPLSATNDLVFDADGQLWFTDMGRIETHGKKYGGLYSARPDGSRIVRVMAGALSYNGIGLSPDMATVYVADTYQARIYAFERRSEPQKPRFVATVPGPVSLDSLAITAAGNVCVATIGETGGGFDRHTRRSGVRNRDRRSGNHKPGFRRQRHAGRVDDILEQRAARQNALVEGIAWMVR